MKTNLRCLLVAMIGLAGCERQGEPGPDVETSKGPAPAAAPVDIYQIAVKDIHGRDMKLADYEGKVVLVVNVASKCGYTPQYEGLQALYGKYKDKGLVVLGVPSNDFGGQEPGTEAEIKAFCTTKYGVTFPMLSKVSVKDGADQCDLYGYLTDKSRNGVLDAEVSWNFNKFLVGKDGKVIRHFPSKVKPDDSELVNLIEEALGMSAEG